MVILTTVENEMLDQICARYYGTENLDPAVSLVLNENQNLSRYPLALPAGLEIKLPDLPQEPQKTVALWD